MPPIAFRLPAAAACFIFFASSAAAFVPADEAGNATADASASAGQTGPSGYDPPIQPPSDEAERALSAFRVPAGMKASLVAAEPDLANPVAFWIDEKGRYWVCETFRQGNAVVDNRGRDYWLLDDLAAQTVEDRVAYYRKHLGEEGFAKFSEHHDRIRLLTDTNGDGKVDAGSVFADGFNNPEDGTGAGVLTAGSDVYYTNIPHLWRLRDTNADGVADEREKLASGFGVRTAFRGHDMHGLTMGPDGRIYFSIGDRGYNVVTKEGKRLARPDCGAVFRCEPDGSNLEVFAYGLRNPQELAFDDYGNLFTGDNNSDSGDKARWVYVAEGSDSGWRMYYQYLDDRGPWNRELMWLPRETPASDREVATGAPVGVAVKDIQPAYILPPIVNLGDGPSGLTYYPGVGLSDRYKGHFFMCDFRGTPNNSGVRSFAVERNGAGFKVVDSHEFIWSILATDADFAPDGRFVISDWVNGWNGEGKGRLYAFSDEANAQTGEKSVRLLAEGFDDKSRDGLLKLLDNRDRRVRWQAHLALASQITETDSPEMIQAEAGALGRLGKLHHAWAVGIAARRTGNAKLIRTLANLTDGLEPDLQPSAIDFYGDALAAFVTLLDHFLDAKQKGTITAGVVGSFVMNRYQQAFLDESKARLKRGLTDTNPRVRAASAVAFGKIAGPKDVPALVKVLEGDGGADPVLRNAAATGLTRIMRELEAVPEWRPFVTTEVAKLAGHPDPAARLTAVVALRRLESSALVSFLGDADPLVVTEVARAINDVPVATLTPQLAALSAKPGLNAPILRRALNANFRLGGRKNAEAVANVAADEKAPTAIRVEAVTELKLWSDPPQTDRVTGMYRPVEPRDAAFLADVFRPMLGDLLKASDAGLRTAAIELAATYKVAEAVPVLREFVTDTDRRDAERVAALKAVASIGADDLNALLADAVEDQSAAVRSQARSLWAEHDPTAAVPALEKAFQEGETVEKQAAIATLASVGNAEADAALGRWLDDLAAGKVEPEVQLDLLEAAEKREPLKAKFVAVEAARSDGDVLAAWRVSLEGGDAEKGRDIFLNRASVSCQRCHKVEEGRGGEVGPDLSKIGSQKDRNYILESLVVPNAKIAEGFESLIVVTADGLVITGVKRAEDEKTLTLVTAEGKGVVIPKEEIEDRAAGKSAMPEDVVKHLTKRDVRDLVEYLASQKGQGRWEKNSTEE